MKNLKFLKKIKEKYGRKENSKGKIKEKNEEKEEDVKLIN